MPKQRRSNNKRDHILDAAESVALELGAAHLTLDAVAKKARMGKGGLIYHFPSKEALLRGMVERVHEGYRQGMRAALTDPASRGDFAVAHVRSLSASGKRQRQLSTILLAAAANYPGLLRSLQKDVAALYREMLRRKPDDSRAVIAMLAVNGLYLMEQLGVGPLGKKERERVIRDLEALV